MTLAQRRTSPEPRRTADGLYAARIPIVYRVMYLLWTLLLYRPAVTPVVRRVRARYTAPVPLAGPVQWYPGLHPVHAFGALSTWTRQAEGRLAHICEDPALSTADRLYYRRLLSDLRQSVATTEERACLRDQAGLGFRLCEDAIRTLVWLARAVHERVGTNEHDPGEELEFFLAEVFQKHMISMANELDVYLGTCNVAVDFMVNRWWEWATITAVVPQPAESPKVVRGPILLTTTLSDQAIWNLLAQPTRWFERFQALVTRDETNVIGREVYEELEAPQGLTHLERCAWYVERLIGAAGMATNYPGMKMNTAVELHEFFCSIFPSPIFLVAECLRGTGGTASFLRYRPEAWMEFYSAGFPEEDEWNTTPPKQEECVWDD